MIAPIDPQLKKFYREMGYTENQIYQAFQCAKNTGIDMLDALAMTQQYPPQTQPQSVSPPTLSKPRDPSAPLQSFAYKSTSTFLTPWHNIKINDYQIFFSRSNKHMQPYSKIQLRQQNYPVGLLNVSNCCYLNSLLQCYYLMNSFKVAILTAEPLPNLEQALSAETKTKIKRIKSQYDLLAQFKKFFTTMALTSKKYLDPTVVLRNLVDSVGDKVSYGQEKDLSEINILIIERLSEGLQHSKNYYEPPQHDDLLGSMPTHQSTIIDNQSKRPYNSIFNPRQGPIKRLFYGTKVEYYDDPQQQKQPPVASDFTGIILHPRAGSLYKALDEEFNFEVEINGGFYKKSVFIREQPEYLFLYINRTDYDREQGQALKNQHKFHFDFTFYLDRYLQKYRQQHGNSHQKIKELLATKNKIKEQMNFLQILFKKIEECQKYAQELDGWGDKLPKEEQFEQEFHRLEEKLEIVQKELDEVQSRKQQYHLMYIFVHRGDAVSGHYWGYGRNADQWYRFDINTSHIQQDQIVIDLQKSAATPYALLYVKANNLPKFDYRLLLDVSVLKEKYPPTDFRGCYDAKIASEIIYQNQRLYQESIKRSYHNIKSKTFTDYVSRFNAVTRISSRYQQQNNQKQHLLRVEMTNNFSLFLWSKNQHDLYKFTLFEQALITASANRYNIQSLMHQTELLHKIQKKFKKSCLGELTLKFYGLLPKEVERLSELYQQYQISAFEVVWASAVLNGAEIYLDEWNSQKAKSNGTAFEPSTGLRNYVISSLKLLKLRRNLYKNQSFQIALKSLSQPLYISQINNQITKLLTFHISTTGLKIDGLQQFTDLSDQIGAQIATINAANSYLLDLKSINCKSSPLQQAIDLMSQFQTTVRKTTKRQSVTSTMIKAAEQPRKTTKSGFKNSFLASPSKTTKSKSINQSTAKDTKALPVLITSQKEILILQTKQLWRSEELEHTKINHELGPKLLIFLKKLGIVPRLYKKLVKEERVWSLAELKEEGLSLNQPQQIVIEESLI